MTKIDYLRKKGVKTENGNFDDKIYIFSGNYKNTTTTIIIVMINSHSRKGSCENNKFRSSNTMNLEERRANWCQQGQLGRYPWTC